MGYGFAYVLLVGGFISSGCSQESSIPAGGAPASAYPTAMPFGFGLPPMSPFASPFMAAPSCVTYCIPRPMMFPMMPWSMPPPTPTCGAPTPPTCDAVIPEENMCQRISNALECVSYPECGYCNSDDFPSYRCDTSENLKASSCDPRGLYGSIIPDVVANPYEETPVIPLPLLPTLSRNFTVTFELGKHPIDVYYLMDYSGSMWDDKSNLVSLSSKLISAIGEMSKDYTLGFGSFVDKPVSPMGSSSDYSFINQQSLSKDTSSFTQRVEDTQILSGGDGPEGSADAMFQVIACTSEIGWRKNARHLLILATDDLMHLAGDGAAGGITTPFDGKCHLDKEGKYTEEKTLDYPSVDQIAAAAAENQISVIFALTEYASSYYDDLVEKITPSALGILTEDSSNIISLLKKRYQEFTSSIELEDSETIDEIEIRYFSKCAGVELSKTNKCEMPADGTVEFTVEVELKSCPADPKDWNQVVTINPVGLPTGVEVDISSICRGY